MANYCKYNVIVKGKKNACYAYFGSMSCLDCKDIFEEFGADEEYTLKYTGYCKWDVDCYCTPWEGDFPVVLPEDADEAYQAGEELYWYNTVQERSKMFEVEVWCNSADVEDYDIHPHEKFEHYKCGDDMGSDYSGCNASGYCPAELRIFGDNEEEVSEGMCRCVDCFGVYPEESCREVEDGIFLCAACYEDYEENSDAEDEVGEGKCCCVVCSDVYAKELCHEVDEGVYMCSECFDCGGKESFSEGEAETAAADGSSEPAAPETAPGCDTAEADAEPVNEEAAPEIEQDELILPESLAAPEDAEGTAEETADESAAEEPASEPAEPVAEETTAEVEPAAEETARVIPESIEVSPEVAAAVAVEEAAAAKRRKRGKAWIVWLIIIAIIAAIAAAYVFCEPVTELVNSLIAQLMELLA